MAADGGSLSNTVKLDAKNNILKIYWPSQKKKIMFHVFTPHLRPVFEGAGEFGIFSVPEPRRKLGIFPCPRAYIKEKAGRVTLRQQIGHIMAGTGLKEA